MSKNIKAVFIAMIFVLSLAFVGSARADQVQCTVNYFAVTPQPVSYGSSAIINWSTNNCTNVSIYGGSLNNSANLPLSGSITTNPLFGTTAFTINANNQYNYAYTQSTTATVANNPNTGGQYYGYQNQTYTPCSIVSFKSSPDSVVLGSNSTLSWTTTGCNSVTLTGPNISNATQALNGSVNTGALYAPTTYVLNASGDNSNFNNYYPYFYSNPIVDSKSLLILVSQSNTNIQTTTPVVNTVTSTVTGVATNIRSTSAQLNGMINQPSLYNADVYFQWGTDQTFNTATRIQKTGSVIYTPFFDTLFNLYPNTTYYFRAVAVSSTGTVYGNVKSFRTSSIPTTTIIKEEPKPEVVSGIGSSSNSISFGITSGSNSVCAGDNINYTVSYQNISNILFNNAVIQVILPRDIEFIDSRIGIYNSADHTITLAVGSLSPGYTGTINISGTVIKGRTKESLIVANATISFQNSVNNSQESVVAYALNDTTSCSLNSNIAGLALFGSSFLPTNLIGWLIVVLIILGLIVMANIIFRNNAPIVMPPSKKSVDPKINRYEPPHTPSPERPHYEEMNIPTYEDEE